MQQHYLRKDRKIYTQEYIKLNLKGTGTRDLIWLKVVSLDRSWLVGLTDDIKKILKCCFIILINFFKS